MTSRLSAISGAILLAAAGTLAAAPCQLDSSFDSDGRARFSIPGFRVSARHVVTHPAGGYLVAGQGTNRASGEFVAFLLRVKHDGSPDDAFGTGGITTWTGAGGGVSAAESRTAGLALGANGSSYLLVDLDVNSQFQNEQRVLRFDAAGQLDPGYGANGIATTGCPTGGSIAAGGIVVDGIGRAFVSAWDNLFTNSWVLARLTASGMPDLAFGMAGCRSYLQGSGTPYLVAREAGLELVAAVDGRARTFRVTFDGAPDMTYGGGDGVVDTTGFTEAILGVALQGDRLLASTFTGGLDDFRVLRLDGTGQLDTSFGDGTGQRTVPITPGFDFGTGIALPNGRIVLVGVADALSQESIGVAYLDAEGRPAPECDAAQTYAIAEGPQASSSAISAVADGTRVVAVGATSNTGDAFDEVGIIAIDPDVFLQDGFED